MKHYRIIPLLFLLMACDVSSISDADINVLSKLKVLIYITESDEEGKLKEIKVRLTDGDKQIINDKIHVLMNDEPLELYVKNELYYTKTSYYRDTVLVPKEAYYFEMISPNGTKHSLAYIKPKEKRDSIEEHGLINPSLINESSITYRYVQDSSINKEVKLNKE